MNKILYVILILALSLSIFSCKSKTVYNESIEIPDFSWDMNNLAKFEPTIDSLNIPYDILLKIRHAHLYPSSNLWLFISTTSPSGKMQVDTFECLLADETGEWFGDGAGDIWDVEIPYQQNIAFSEQGKYLITIQHGMRMEKLPLIMEIGLCIKKAELKEESK